MSVQPTVPEHEPRRPSDRLSPKERTTALRLLREARILVPVDASESAEAAPDETLALDAYVVSGNRIPNRMVGTAEPLQQVPDATATPEGRVMLRRLRKALESILDLPEDQRVEDPYPEPASDGP